MKQQVKVACDVDTFYPLNDLRDFQGELKSLSTENYTKLKKSLIQNGITMPFHVWDSGDGFYILDGHQRRRVLIQMRNEGYETENVPIVKVLAEDWKAAKRILLSMISQYGHIARQGLYEYLVQSDIAVNELTESFDIPEVSMDIDKFQAEFFKDLTGKEDGERKTLSERFLVPPFSVLDARQGYWQDRKREWVAIGIESELGRGGECATDDTQTVKGMGMCDAVAPRDRGWKESKNSLGNLTERHKHGMTNTETVQKIAAVGTGTSIFDPVLCELAYRWFSPKLGTVLDPFAGGSVRGIVCSRLGRRYFGCDLRKEQIEANQVQGDKICTEPKPMWKCGDSRDIQTHYPDLKVDLVFSCPPYADLEIYSDDPQDISSLGYEEFLPAYRQIINQSCQMLKDNRFACFVVGDLRDKKGIYRNFVSHTIQAFIDAGLSLYNEAILVIAVGSLPIRAGLAFSASRKLGKTHQNVLVFVKGDPKKATQECGEVEIAEITKADSTQIT